MVVSFLLKSSIENPKSEIENYKFLPDLNEEKPTRLYNERGLRLKGFGRRQAEEMMLFLVVIY